MTPDASSSRVSSGVTPPRTNGRRSPLRRVVSVLGWIILSVLLLLVSLWAIAALYMDFPIRWLRVPLAIAYPAVLLAGWYFLKRPFAVLGTLIGFALVLG